MTNPDIANGGPYDVVYYTWCLVVGRYLQHDESELTQHVTNILPNHAFASVTSSRQSMILAFCRLHTVSYSSSLVCRLLGISTV